MKQLKNNRGEGQISVGAKIILAVVIGALILGGLYLLFDRVILRNTDRQIKELMAAGGSSEVLEVRTTDNSALSEVAYNIYVMLCLKTKEFFI